MFSVQVGLRKGSIMSSGVINIYMDEVEELKGRLGGMLFRVLEKGRAHRKQTRNCPSS